MSERMSGELAFEYQLTFLAVYVANLEEAAGKQPSAMAQAAFTTLRSLMLAERAEVERPPQNRYEWLKKDGVWQMHDRTGYWLHPSQNPMAAEVERLNSRLDTIRVAWGNGWYGPSGEWTLGCADERDIRDALYPLPQANEEATR